MNDQNNKPSFDVVLLAAGRGADDPMAQIFNTKHKCLIDIAGMPMIMRVLGALRKCPDIGRIAISIEDKKILKSVKGFKKLPKKRGIVIVESSDQISQSIENAIIDAKLRYPVLITTADHALLSKEMLDHFCVTSRAAGGDITVALAHEDVIKMAYPRTLRTYFKFSDGKFSGCNMFGLLTKRSLNAVRFWQSIQRERKRPWRIAKAFGYGILARYFIRALSLADVTNHASKLMNADIDIIRIPFAEAAMDVDKPEDLALAVEILRNREE